MKIPSDFITATGEIHDWDSLGQVAYVAHVDASSLGRAARWEAVAQAVRAAVIEECAKACEMEKLEGKLKDDDHVYNVGVINCASGIRSLK